MVLVPCGEPSPLDRGALTLARRAFTGPGVEDKQVSPCRLCSHEVTCGVLSLPVTSFFYSWTTTGGEVDPFRRAPY